MGEPWVRKVCDPDLRKLNLSLSEIVTQERIIYDSQRALKDAEVTRYQLLNELVRNVDIAMGGVARQQLNWTSIRNTDGDLIASLLNVNGANAAVQSLFKGGPKTLGSCS